MTDKIEKSYYIGIHHYSFRPNQPAEIIGVVTYYPPNIMLPRPCFHVKYSDGFEDFCPISDSDNYRLISEAEMKMLFKS